MSSHRSGHLYVWSTDVGAGVKIHVPQSLVLHKEPQDATIYAIRQKQKSSLLYSWKIGHGSINAFVFSPDSIHIAIVSQDGFLRVYNFKEHTLYGRMRSYFGGLLCVCWSPDGKYVVTGGEDDLVTVWSFEHKRVVARGQGHKSYVTTVAFDPYMTILPSGYNSPTNHREDMGSPVPVMTTQTKGECSSTAEKVSTSEDVKATGDDTMAPGTSTPLLARHGVEAAPPHYTAYRLGSIGQDTQLCLWDLSGDTLNRRRLYRGRSRNTRQYSSRPVSTADLALDPTTMAMEDTASSDKRNRDVQEKENSRPLSRADKSEEAEGQQVDALKSAGGGESKNGQNDEVKVQDSLRPNHLGPKERSPTVSVSSTSSNTSKKGKRKRKEKTEKGEKEKERNKSGRSTRKTLKEPVKKVVGKLMNTFTTSNQSGGHGRGQMGNFETCYSDDIAPKMTEVNHMEPLVAEKISQERLTSLLFKEDCFLTACQEGFVQTWARPGVCIQDIQVKEPEEEPSWKSGHEVDEVNQHRPMYSNAASNSGVSTYIHTYTHTYIMYTNTLSADFLVFVD